MSRSNGPVLIVVGIFSALLVLFVEELVVGAVWSALAPEFTRSLDVITNGYGGVIVTLIEIGFFILLVLGLWAIVSKHR